MKRILFPLTTALAIMALVPSLAGMAARRFQAGEAKPGNRTPVRSTCDDWLNYPKLTGKSRTVTSADWGSGEIREHHRWWFRHLPRAPGRTAGRLNNWWAYVVDFNRYPESRKEIAREQKLVVDRWQPHRSVHRGRRMGRRAAGV